MSSKLKSLTPCPHGKLVLELMLVPDDLNTIQEQNLTPKSLAFYY